MGRIKRQTIALRHRKKGQLFLIEVFIALTVLVLLMTAIYQIDFTTIPKSSEKLSTIGYTALDSLHSSEALKPMIYNEQTDDLKDSLNELLPANILWRLNVLDEEEQVVFDVYWEREPSSNSNLGISEYILYGYNDALDNYRIIHLELWQLIR
ncbi:MAG: hypothetical protein EU542_06885 [Promethearchaeota archaeon]|nr:MAG: hypothetical protein EU542_06885 [Candidatus Lokiarchaeota archaeon]